MADVKFKTIDRGALRIRRELKVAAGKVALVGIPGTADPVLDANGKPSEISMAQLAFIMEKGSDVNKIPARPFMERTRQRCESDVAKFSRKLYGAILHGRAGANQALKLLGERYEGEMKQTFTKETFAPNAPITINGGWMRNKVNGKVFKVKGKGSSRPLIDTGRLRGSIIHKVAKV